MLNLSLQALKTVYLKVDFKESRFCGFKTLVTNPYSLTLVKWICKYIVHIKTCSNFSCILLMRIKQNSKFRKKIVLDYIPLQTDTQSLIYQMIFYTFSCLASRLYFYILHCIVKLKLCWFSKSTYRILLFDTHIHKSWFSLSFFKYDKINYLQETVYLLHNGLLFPCLKSKTPSD